MTWLGVWTKPSLGESMTQGEGVRAWEGDSETTVVPSRPLDVVAGTQINTLGKLVIRGRQCGPRTTMMSAWGRRAIVSKRHRGPGFATRAVCCTHPHKQVTYDAPQQHVGGCQALGTACVLETLPILVPMKGGRGGVQTCTWPPQKRPAVGNTANLGYDEGGSGAGPVPDPKKVLRAGNTTSLRPHDGGGGGRAVPGP